MKMYQMIYVKNRQVRNFNKGFGHNEVGLNENVVNGSRIRWEFW